MMHNNQITDFMPAVMDTDHGSAGGGGAASYRRQRPTGGGRTARYGWGSMWRATGRQQ